MFNKKFVQSEDNWVAFLADSIGDYSFGFIYIDSQAGLTLDYSGSFKIDNTGKYIVKKKELDGAMKYRLQPNNTLVAIIPEQKLNELGVEKIPDWLKFYKDGEGTVERLYKWGYMYNGWNECEKALTYLEKAEKIDSKFKGLQTELAFSYNALNKFEKAEIALIKALSDNPNDCYSMKELAYTYRHLDKLDKSAEIYNKMKSCSEKKFIQETAYNLAYKYFELKDKKNFIKWNQETRKWGAENIYTKNLDKFEKEFN
jgi:tetratricopeptide (TPR) repeat protein